MKQSPRIGIVDCGTGGHAAALRLARYGHRIEALYRARQQLRMT